MEKITNAYLLESVLKALYTVAGRRTSSKFADKTIGSTIKTLEETYDFLRYVTIDEHSASNGGFTIQVSPDIDAIEPSTMGKAIEAIIRVVYTDLDEEAGLYFIAELKENAGDMITSEIANYNVDLGQMQIEQHHFFRRLERKHARLESEGETLDTPQEKINQLGYTWDSVSSWKHDIGTNYCTLYDKQGEVLDRLNLDTIIESYIEKLSGYAGASKSEYEEKVEVYEKEYQLLELMSSQDMNAASAAETLHITQDELNAMIKKLSKIQLLQYISYDVVELTDTGMSYLSNKENKKSKMTS